MIETEGFALPTADTLIRAAKNTGAYVGIQNLDASNAVHITFGGKAATATEGIRIGPGEFFDTLAPYNGSEIRGIAITGACNIVIVGDK